MYSLSLNPHVLQEEDKSVTWWRGAHGLPSAPLVTLHKPSHLITQCLGLSLTWERAMLLYFTGLSQW